MILTVHLEAFFLQLQIIIQSETMEVHQKAFS